MNKKGGFMIRKSVNLFVLFMVLLFINGCVTTMGGNPVIDNTYKILATTQIAYDNAMTTVSILYSKGKITTEQKDKVVSVARDFVASYKVVVKALEMYAEGTSGQITVDEAVNKFVEVQIMFVNLVREVISNG